MASCTHGFAFTCDSSSCISLWHDEESGNNFFFNDGSAKLGHRVEALFQGPSRCTMSSRDIDFPSGALQRCCSLWSGGNSSSATQFIQFGGAFRDFWRVNSGSSFGKQCGL